MLTKSKKPLWSKTAYRVRRFPAEYDCKELSQLIQDLFEIGPGDFKIHSLSLDLTEDGTHKKVATVSFRETPQEFDHNEDQEWGFDLPSCTESGARIYFDTNFKGFTPLTPADQNAECDMNCIFLHGWGGHAIGSFTYPRSSYSWMRDDLPKRFPKLRVWTFGYGSRLNDANSTSDPFEYAKKLAQALRSFRHNTVDKLNPMIFVAHSLGGLVFKQAMVYMSKGNINTDDWNNLQLIRGALFFGVPGQGLDTTALVNLLEGSAAQYTSSLLDRSVGWRLREDQEQEFYQILPDNDFRLVKFYELRKTPKRAWDEAKNQWIYTKETSLLVDTTSAVFGLRAPDGEDFTISIDKDHMNMVKFSENDESDYPSVCYQIRQIMKDAQSIVQKRLQQQRLREDKVTAREEAPDHKEFLKSLKFENMDMREDDISKPAASTCTWLLSHSVYLEWSQSSANILWIKGKPGAGKSTLLKYAYEAAKDRLEDQAFIVSFFFHGRGSLLQKTLAGLYRSLIYQLVRELPGLRKKLGRHADPFRFDDNKSSQDSARQNKELAGAFEKCLLQAARVSPLQVYIDALDEAGEIAARELIEIFQRVLHHVRGAQGTFKVCFSCRHYPLVALDGGLDIVVEHENSTDINKYVASQFSTISKSHPATKEIQEQIVTKSCGIFQWTVLVVPRILESFRLGHDAKSIEEQIEELPSGLWDLYQTSLDSTSSHDAARSLLLLRWTVLAQHPLSLKDASAILFGYGQIPLKKMILLYEALHSHGRKEDTLRIVEAIFPELEPRVKDLSKGLVELSPDYLDIRLQVIHHSVKDYLTSSNFGSIGVTSKPGGSSHFLLAMYCLEYLNMPELRVEILGENSGLGFKNSRAGSAHIASWDWGTYTGTLSQDLISYFIRWSRPERSRDFDLPYVDPTESLVIEWGERGKIVVPTVYAAGTLLDSLNEKISGDTQEKLRIWCRARVMIKFPFLYYAVDNWAYHAKSADASKLEQCDWKAFNTALDCAVDMLMTYHVYAYRKDHGRSGSWSGIASPWISSLDLVSGLYAAIVEGLVQSTRIYCEQKCAVFDTETCRGNTPLHLAICKGHENVVDILLNCANNDVFATDNDENTLLHDAAASKLETIVVKLLKRGLSVDSRNSRGKTPLHLAAYSLSVPIMKLLIDAGANINCLDSHDQTPLHMVCSARHNYQDRESKDNEQDMLIREAMQFLVDHGTCIKKQPQTGGAPIAEAVESSHWIEAELLLKAGADIDEVDELNDPGNSLLSRALNSPYGRSLSIAREHLVRALRFLLDNHADPNWQNYAGWTVMDRFGYTLFLARRLQWADGKEILAKLLQNGAKPNVRGTVLYGPRSRYDRRVDEIEALDFSKRHILVLAVSHAKEFLSDPQITEWHPDNNKGIMEEETYCVNIYMDIIAMLLNAGAKADIDQKEYQTLFSVAEKYGRTEIIERIKETQEVGGMIEEASVSHSVTI